MLTSGDEETWLWDVAKRAVFSVTALLILTNRSVE